MSKRLLRGLAALTGAAALTAGSVMPASAQQARALLTATDGSLVGTIILAETPHGVLLDVRIDVLPAGVHAIHIHTTGVCTAPDFKSAGGHYAAGGREHGLHNAHGKHEGDLPNIHVAADGTLTVEILADAVSLDRDGPRAPLVDSDGSAFVIHADADDYASNPAGAAGARIACGVIEPAS